VIQNLHLLAHPILRYKLSQLRDPKTNNAQFRTLIKEMATLITYEATHDLTLQKHPSREIEFLNSPIVVSIMRAGNEMLDGVLQVLPEARSGHIGIYRDRLMQKTVEYYFRLPKQIMHKTVFLLDPLIATGDTLMACIDRLKQFEVGTIKALCLIASQSGIEKIFQNYPDVEIYTAAVESELTAEGFLVRGIGDVGNRLYGTLNEEQTHGGK
jgi:uracil phosphoribosyltransferase